MFHETSGVTTRGISTFPRIPVGSAASLVAVSLFLAQPAFAQTSQATAQDAQNVGNTDFSPGDIVVTAQKRAQNINDVGVTVTAVTADTLKTKQISSLDDVAKLVPGLSYSNTQSGTPVYTLRGVGFYDTSLGSYPTVSVYLDEVPLPFPVLTRHSAFDLERLEVLKGPQGTLFGQNATGGAINYIAAKPTTVLQGGVEAGYSRFNMFTGEAFLSGPINDNLSFRVAGRVEHGDGWQVSNTRPGDRNADTRNYMGRILLGYDSHTGVRLNLNLNGWIDKSETQAPQVIAYFPTYPVTPADGGAFNYALSPDRPRAADWTPGIPHADNRLWQAALRTEIDVSDEITLTSLTSYTHYKQNQGTEGDGLPIQTLDIVSDRGLIKTFSQELRLSNGGRARLRWTVGGNFERSTIDQSARILYGDSFASIYLGKALGYPISGNIYSIDQKVKNYAAFGNVEYDIGELTLKAGARYTKSDRSASVCNRDPIGAPGGTGDFFYDVLLGGAYGSYVPNVCYAINAYPNGDPVVSSIPVGSPGRFTGELNEDNVSWRIGADWKPARRTLFYANISKGYKAGAFPTTSASTFAQYLPVKQESVLAYEVGFKLQPVDRLLQLNGAAYYYDYNDKQLRSKLIDPVFGLLDVIQNIPKSDVKGFELEAVLTPSEAFTLSAAFTYTDAKIKEFTGISASGVTADFAGARVPFTPKYQAGGDAEYRIPLNDTINAFVGGSVNYRSQAVSVVGGDVNPVQATPQRPNLFGIKGYALVDLRAGIRSSDDRWRFQVWGKNVFNKYYWNNVVSLADVIARYSGMPATYGATVGYRF